MKARTEKAITARSEERHIGYIILRASHKYLCACVVQCASAYMYVTHTCIRLHRYISIYIYVTYDTVYASQWHRGLCHYTKL